jgi:hypothetical protein
MKILASLIPAGCLLLRASDNNPLEQPYTVHEWGTFTSIAGAKGEALEWQPFGGPSDLPCFVHRFQVGFKANLAGKVRMETPVIYFYAPHKMTASVHVAFPHGYITEWYPKANQVATHMGSGSVFDYPNPPKQDPSTREPRNGEPDSIEWPQVRIDPQTEPKYPFQFESSHYYAARSTDSAPVKVGDETEKFLFYRGVGQFQPPIAVENIANDRLRIRNLGRDALPAVIVFQNTNAKIRYRSLGALNGEMITEIPKTGADLAALKRDLENILTVQGLFPKEAHAMIETWGDSWFEEGARVFYILPASGMESLLPLQIEPRPARIARVFVGRVEVITPEIRNIITRAIERGDRETVEKHGRFLQPIADQFPGSGLVHDAFQKYLRLETACSAGGKEW